MAIILFAPSGLAGLIVMHGAIVAHPRAIGSGAGRVCGRARAARVMASGRGAALIEMSYPRVDAAGARHAHACARGSPSTRRRRGLDRAARRCWSAGSRRFALPGRAWRRRGGARATRWRPRAAAVDGAPLERDGPTADRLRARAPRRRKALRRDPDHSRRVARRRCGASVTRSSVRTAPASRRCST